MSSIAKSAAAETVGSALTRASKANESLSVRGVYHFLCFDKDGNLKWEDESSNLVVNVGLQDMNTKYFTGSSYTAAWYIGLYGAGASNTPAAGDTMASHAGWTEVTAYTGTNRITAVFGTATTANPSVISNAAAGGGTVAVFNINAGATVGGAFLTNTPAKTPGNTGILFSASDFTGGDRAVVSGDTLNVTYTFQITAT